MPFSSSDTFHFKLFCLVILFTIVFTFSFLVAKYQLGHCWMYFILDFFSLCSIILYKKKLIPFCSEKLDWNNEFQKLMPLNRKNETCKYYEQVWDAWFSLFLYRCELLLWDFVARKERPLHKWQILGSTSWKIELKVPYDAATFSITLL